MADQERGLKKIRTGASSRRSSRSRPSRPSTPPHLARMVSARFLDDHSVYHAHDDHEHAVEEAEDPASHDDSLTEDDADLGVIDAEKEAEEERELGHESTEDEDEVLEVRDGIPDVRDVEKDAPKLQKTKSSRSIKDPNLVSWDGPEDTANPKNWSMKRKWAATFVVSSFTFISPVSSSMVAPALTSMARDLKITNKVESQLMLSIFVLAYAVGPLFLGPLSELYGRVPVLQISNLFFLCWNLGCGFAQTKGQMLAFRFLSGLGGSAPLALGGGILSDCFRAEERGKSISIYSLAPLLGPAVGPIAGGFIAENTSWRWCFWSVSIVDVLIQVCGVLFLQETYGPVLLQRKAAKLRKETGNEALHTEYDHPDRSLARHLGTALVRPFRLLGTQPIVQVLACYMAYIYGLMYLVLSTFPTLWTDVYHESIGIGSLNYISLGLGFFLGTQISAPLNDRIYRRLKKRYNEEGRPEFRTPLILPGALLVPIGLFWYGWSAQAQIHWIMPNIGAVFFAAGTIIGFQCIQSYLIDSYTRFAASAVASATVLRSLAGFGFPLFAPAMYSALGDGWGNSVLGIVAIVLGVPAPFLLWKYGPTLRAKSKFAAG